jgi:hypothetical protein
VKPRLAILAAIALAAAFAAGGTPATSATSPPSADQFAIDMDPYVSPVNTSTSVGPISTCDQINQNGVLDADEEAIDAVDFDVVTAPNGIPAANPAIAFGYTLNYQAVGGDPTITSYTPMYFPGSVSTGDVPPDNDGTFVAIETDPTAVGKSGPGTLGRFRVHSTIAPAGGYLLTLTNASHIDTGGVPRVPDSLGIAMLMIDATCYTESDLKMISQDTSLQAVLPAGFDRALTIDAVIHQNGPDKAPAAIDATLTLPAGCTADGQAGTYVTTLSLSSPALSVPSPAQLTAQINCVQGGSQQITVEGCVYRQGARGSDIDWSNNCNTTVIDFVVDDSDTDGDGFSDADEDGQPLCDDARNEDSFDDAVVDDGCPGGPPQAGAYSEADFNVGTNSLDACGINDWPGDLTSGMPPLDSTDRINVLDITSFLAPTRHFNTNPDDAAYDARWDIVPGRDLFTSWINVLDLTTLMVVKPPAPPYNGTMRAFGGPTCQ